MPAEAPAAVVAPGAPRVGKLVVLGVGLIGGSFALALRDGGRVGTIVGVGRGRENLDLNAINFVRFDGGDRS